MREKIITDEPEESITIRWDGVRFALVQELKTPEDTYKKTLILNPREMMEIVQFASNLGGERQDCREHE